MQHALDVFLGFAGRHPYLALAFIAFIALAESLAIIGTLVPAAIVMFGAGVLVGHGTLAIGWTLGLAAAGAAVGDALSYELGRRKQEQARKSRLLRRYAASIAKAESMVVRYGAASVLLARFTGAVRAFVPLLAGFARMPPGKFYATNVASALLWAPAHILPGVVFGASIHLAEQASGRLAALVLLLAVLVWAAVSAARLTIRWLIPLARRLRERAGLAVGSRRVWWARAARLLLDPGRPDSPALIAGFAVLIGSMWLFLGILEDVVTGDRLVMADQAVFAFLQQLRTVPVDRVMIAITEMGSVGILLPLVLVVAATLGIERCWRTAGYWVATVASSELMVQVLKRTLGRHRPLPLYHGNEQYSFPSGHATLSAVVLAYLAFLLARNQSARTKIAFGGFAAVYVALVGFSRLYLGAHWMSDVMAGCFFGLAAVALSALLYTRHRVDDPLPAARICAIAATTILAAGSLWASWQAPADLRRYSMPHAPTFTSLQAWASGGFRQLPAYRREFAGEREEPFLVQIACSEAQVRNLLERAGWRSAPGLGIASVLQAIGPHPRIGELPVLPKYDAGHASALNLMQLPGAANARLVLRLWQSPLQVEAGIPVWYGTVYTERQARPNFSFLDQASLPAKDVSTILRSAGFSPVPGPAEGPDLWTCSQS